jgi:hypothetical protein
LEKKNSSPLLENITQDSNGLAKVQDFAISIWNMQGKEGPVWVEWGLLFISFL